MKNKLQLSNIQAKTIKELEFKYDKRIRFAKGFIPSWDVSEGWIPLLDKLIGDLLSLGWKGEIEQVKQKFGGLRFYTSGLTVAGESLIDAAERQSVHTCEFCGELGSQRQIKGWIYAACEFCADAVLEGRRPSKKDALKRRIV